MNRSARIVLPGKVLTVTTGVTMASVRIEVAAGIVITATITDRAIEALGLAVGQPATAAIKSCEVIVGVDRFRPATRTVRRVGDPTSSPADALYHAT